MEQEQRLIKLFPAIEPYIPHLEKGYAYAQLTTPFHKALFLANAAHETAKFTKMEENLNYSAERLSQVWPKRFLVWVEEPGPKPGDKPVRVYKPNTFATLIAHDPTQIANAVYGGRFGNDDRRDGWKYRGRGWFHTTFYDNYKYADDKLFLQGTLVENPDRLFEPHLAVMSAAVYWKRFKLNKVKTILESRKIIQGGTLGLDKVEKYYSDIRRVL